MSILPRPTPPVRARSLRPDRSWQTELREAIRDPRELCAALGLPFELAESAGAAVADFPCFVPRPYLARIECGNPADPLLVQVWPAAAEAAHADGFMDDPVGDAAATLRPGLLQKYAGRALLVVTGACAVHCRYCFRRHFPYEDAPPTESAWLPALETIASDPSLTEIILSGGDPLTLTDPRIAWLVDHLASIPHLERLRVHTRLPVMIPSRVTDELLRWLTGSRWTPIMVIHANHARELDDEVGRSLDRLRRVGVLLLNQAVLLRGVNDSAHAQSALSLRLVELGVVPYYLHQLDRVRGAAHFEVPIPRGREIIAQLRRQLPGYAIPRYVEEQPAAEHKLILA